MSYNMQTCLGAKIGYEQNYVEVAEEIPQPPSRQQSIPPTKPQMSVLKPPMAIDNPGECFQKKFMLVFLGVR